MKIPRWLQKQTKDAVSTLAGIVSGVILGAVGGAATAYTQGGVTKEALLAGAAASQLIARVAHRTVPPE